MIYKPRCDWCGNPESSEWYVLLNGEDVELNDRNFKCEFFVSEDGKFNFSLSTKPLDEFVNDDEDIEYWHEFVMSKLITGQSGERKYDR